MSSDVRSFENSVDLFNTIVAEVRGFERLERVPLPAANAGRNRRPMSYAGQVRVAGGLGQIRAGAPVTLVKAGMGVQ